MWIAESGNAVRPTPSSERGGLDAITADTADEILARRFCAWCGITGQRYVASVFAADLQAADCGLPMFSGCIVMSVICKDGSRRIMSVGAIEKAGERATTIDRERAVGIDEWHVHFLADTPRARAAAVADLTQRHLTIVN